MAFAYKQVEAAFAALHGVQPAKRTAFRARLKHLQRLGFPGGVNTGTGKAAVYDAPQILLIGVALELLQLGLTPDRVVKFLLQKEDIVTLAARYSLDGAGEGWPSFFMWFDPYGLSDLMETSPEDRASSTIDIGDADRLFEQVSRSDVLWPRLAVINISSLLRGIYLNFRGYMNETAVPFIAELRSWVGANPQEHHDDNTEA